MSKILARSKNFVTSKVRRKKGSPAQADESVARITNETVAEAREDVLRGARKFIYPLSHSKHRVLMTSTILVVVAILGFFGSMVWLLYRRKDTSNFTYKVTQIVPFPIAKVGSSFVPYENYLFELKRYIFYYNNVEAVDFDNPTYQPQLLDQKQKVLARVVDMAYIKQVAKEQNITVSDDEVDERIKILKDQNRLGNNDKVFEDTLRDFYNWSVNDFRRSIRNDILTSKVLAIIDTDARSKANTALEEVKKGTDFAVVASTYSDDLQTKDLGGEIPGYIDPQDRNAQSEQADILGKLKVGETSEIINLGYGFEILKKLEDKDGTYHAAHIIVSFKPIEEALNEEKANNKTIVYIHL